MDERIGDWSWVASPSLTSAFCIMILSYSLRCRCRRLRLRLCSTTTDGRIVLHQGELWESGHVKEGTEKGREMEGTSLGIPSLSPADRQRQGRCPKRVDSHLGPASHSPSSTDNPIDFLSGKRRRRHRQWATPICHECGQ